MLPIKSHTYKLDLQNSNSTSALGWQYSHELTSLYNMSDLSPTSFVQLAERIRNDENLAMLYWNTQSNGGMETYVPSCDDACRLNAYCSMINTVYFESKDCMNLPRMDFQNDPITTIMETLSDPWVTPK